LAYSTKPSNGRGSRIKCSKLKLPERLQPARVSSAERFVAPEDLGQGFGLFWQSLSVGPRRSSDHLQSFKNGKLKEDPTARGDRVPPLSGWAHRCQSRVVCEQHLSKGYKWETGDGR
jgi:hypothetical protein